MDEKFCQGGYGIQGFIVGALPIAVYLDSRFLSPWRGPCKNPHCSPPLYFSHLIGAIVDSVSGRLNFFRSHAVHLPKQWLSADPVTIESFQFFGFRDIAPLNLSRIIWTYHPRPGGCEPRLGPSFRCHFIFCKYDNLPVQSGTIGEYNRESDTVQMIATHRGNVTADEMLQARFWIAAPALLKYKCASSDCTRQVSPLTGPLQRS